jgi:hypothetical protein
MGCFLEIGMAVWGLYLLVTGETKSPVGKRIRGPLVRIAGLIFMLPFPLAFLAGFGMGFSAGMKGHTAMSKADIASLQLLEIGLIFGCLVIGFGMLYCASISEPERRRDPVFQDRLLCDYDRIFEQPRPERSFSELDEVIPVAAKPPGGEQPRGVTAQRPIPTALPRPRREMTPAVADPMPTPRVEPPKSRKQDVLVFVAAAVIFVVVAWAGSKLMSSSGAAPASASVGQQ